ncbi:unnamed protein product, partial [Medioppia subpectinata]
MQVMSGVGDMGSDSASDGVVQRGCPFCAIANKHSSNETTLLYEDNNYVVIQDIREAVDNHYLLITKKHIKPSLLVVTAVMANQTTNWSDICNQIQSGNYKTVRLTDSRMQLFCGQQSYTFTIGDIRSAQITQISNLYPFDLSPIDECFENNGKVYYIRNNELIQYNGLDVNSYHWNQNQPSIPCLIIKKNGQTIGFFVPNNSCSYSSGQSMSTTNDIQVIAYGSASSVSMSS